MPLITASELKSLANEPCDVCAFRSEFHCDSFSYAATTATMQKYAGLTEDQVNNQSYSLVLEHLERLSKENEEMEKLKVKK